MNHNSNKLMMKVITIAVTASSCTYIPESTTEVYYPKSETKKAIDSKGNIISNTLNKDKKKEGN
jgi:hypothetical protein